jgi:hypothetical protein
MSVFKPFITSDVIVSPFKVNKSFTFRGTELNKIGKIDRYIGRNVTASLWASGSYSTGQITPQDQVLVYHSIRELYYSNYLLNPDGSPAATASFNTDGTITGAAYTPNYYNYLTSTLPANRYFPTTQNSIIGMISIPSNFFGEYIKPGTFYWASPSGSITDDGEGNLLFTSASNVIFSLSSSGGGATTITPTIATGMSVNSTNGISYNSGTGAINLIPNNIFTSASITFTITGSADSLDQPVDFYLSSSEGLSSVYSGISPVFLGTNFSGSFNATLNTGVDYYFYYVCSGTFDIAFAFQLNATSQLLPQPIDIGNIFYEHGIAALTKALDSTIISFVTSSNVTCSFSSSLTIYETQYKCTIRENEFNFSNNPSLLSGSISISNGSGSIFPQPGSGKLNDNVTGSYFSPYITTVGLYNNNKELLAVAKLAQPLPISQVTDTSILINFDF